MRNNLKTLKKSLDNLDKQKKASVMNDVIEEAKRLISQNPNAPFVVKELKAFSNAKVTVDFGFVVCSVLFSYIILNKHTIFYGFQHVYDHIFFTT